MKFYLSGGGIGKDSENISKIFSESIDKSKPLLHIPFAINPNKHSLEKCEEWAKQKFSRFGIKNIFTWEESKDIDDFSKFGGIYICGGDTVRLITTLREKKFFEKIRKFKEIPIFGESAGAAVFSRSIIPALISENQEIEDSSGMNKLKGYELWCHYTEDTKKNITKFLSEQSSKVIALPEESGIILTDGEIESTGKGDVFIFNPKLILLKPGKKFRL